MRDCIRLAIDDVAYAVDLDHPFVKDLSIDASLFAPLRDRSLTLGQFVFAESALGAAAQAAHHPGRAPRAVR
jgi:hypothetical protein